MVLAEMCFCVHEAPQTSMYTNMEFFSLTGQLTSNCRDCVFVCSTLNSLKFAPKQLIIPVAKILQELHVNPYSIMSGSSALGLQVTLYCWAIRTCK